MRKRARQLMLLDLRDHALISETLGYLQGLAAAFEAHHGPGYEPVVTPAADAYARLLAARLRTLRAAAWPVDD